MSQTDLDLGRAETKYSKLKLESKLDKPSFSFAQPYFSKLKLGLDYTKSPDKLSLNLA